MTFKDWILSSPQYSGAADPWGAFHIITLVSMLVIAASLAILLRKGSDKAKGITILTLVSLILFFEIARRVINFIKAGTDLGISDVLYMLLPRPWCAISCWLLIASVIIGRKFFYNISSMSALICSIIFFASPSVGFRVTPPVFEDIYSVMTHALLFITAVCLIALGFVDFSVKRNGSVAVWQEAALLCGIFAYGFTEIYLLKIEADPMYFMPGSDVQQFLGLEYAPFLVIYILFLLFYFCLPYGIRWLIKRINNARGSSKAEQKANDFVGLSH